LIAAVLTLALPAFAAGFGLAWAARRLPADREPVVQRIDALLPQTQCAQCGYPGCRPYARAVAAGEADIDQCPPGGTETMRALAELLGRNEVPLPPAHQLEAAPLIAVIRESECIGCARCLTACPVDAIVGAPQYLHTVIEAECTGCELCLAPCPVDCIDLVRPAAGAAGR
jgi:electron transport complex protein RnfB